MTTHTVRRPVQHRIDWELVDELLMELSGGVPYSTTWASRVMGADERNVLRFKTDGVPDRYVESLLERANRGVIYDQEHPPPRGSISGKHSRHYFVQERVPFSVIMPFLVDRLGEDYTSQQAMDLFGVKKHTFWDWRKKSRPGHRTTGVPVWRILAVLGVTRAELGLPEEVPDAYETKAV